MCVCVHVRVRACVSQTSATTHVHILLMYIEGQHVHTSHVEGQHVHILLM